jgi:hypothetical protein
MRYQFTFISLISPYLLSDLRIHDISSSPSKASKATSLVKQSYLLFTWFYYLKESKIVNQSLTESTKNPILFSFLPVRRKAYTLTKAPMAHKTNSKEQFVFRYFKFKMSINTRFLHNDFVDSINLGLLSILLSKNHFPFFETNLLLLKNYTLTFPLSDLNFFNFYLFLPRNSSR